MGYFMYDKIPFGIMNVVSRFHRDVEIDFSREKDKFIVIDFDDITVFSKLEEEHLKHLKQTFLKFRKYWLSLNPKKSHFFHVGRENPWLNILSSKGIKHYQRRVQEI